MPRRAHDQVNFSVAVPVNQLKFRAPFAASLEIVGLDGRRIGQTQLTRVFQVVVVDFPPQVNLVVIVKRYIGIRSPSIPAAGPRAPRSMDCQPIGSQRRRQRQFWFGLGARDSNTLCAFRGYRSSRCRADRRRSQSTTQGEVYPQCDSPGP